MSTKPPPVYLDHNATTPIDPEVQEAMQPFLSTHFGNPSSNHPYGWKAVEGVMEAREEVATLLGCDAEEIIFTSGGTESNNLAIRGVAGHARRAGRLITSAVEHPATVAPLAHLERRGWKVVRAPVDGDGIVELGVIEGAIDETTQLVTVMHANNETGSVQPIQSIAEVAHARGVPVHTDAAQSVGKLRTRVNDLGVDLLSVAGHKLYGPKGVGALYVRRGLSIEPVVRGAGHEGGLRPGTENVAGVVGLGAACRVAREKLGAEEERQQVLRDRLWQLLADAVPQLRRNGHATERLPNTLNVSFPGVRSSLLLPRADEIAASAGSACHEGGEETPSPVLVAMGLTEAEAFGAVRLTLGRSTSEEDIRMAAESLISAFNEVRATT